jgi:hypothetical protein
MMIWWQAAADRAAALHAILKRIRPLRFATAFKFLFRNFHSAIQNQQVQQEKGLKSSLRNSGVIRIRGSRLRASVLYELGQKLSGFALNGEVK